MQFQLLIDIIDNSLFENFKFYTAGYNMSENLYQILS